jgi:hypothetical protein
VIKPDHDPSYFNLNFGVILISGSSEIAVRMSECETCGVRLNTGEMVVHMVTHMSTQRASLLQTGEGLTEHSTCASPVPSDSSTTSHPTTPEVAVSNEPEVSHYNSLPSSVMIDFVIYYSSGEGIKSSSDWNC